MMIPTRLLDLHGELTSADMHKTEPVFVDVPEGVTNLHFTFLWPKWSPNQKMPNQISVMIFDPNGPRFEISRPDDAGVSINAGRTSPGGIDDPAPWPLDGLYSGLSPACRSRCPMR